MLDVVAFIEPKPHTFDKCKQLILEIISATRAESGCLRFELYHHPQSHQLVLIERWLHQQALDFHYAQPYVQQIFAYYEQALQSEPKIFKLMSPTLSMTESINDETDISH